MQSLLPPPTSTRPPHKMTSTRVPPLPTNLKERIAAIEQKVGNAGPSSRSISPAPGALPNAPTNAGALRDKIAKFEGKGGIPAPRSRFGMGAPPTAQAPQRSGELYGNRIPAPARSVSNGVYPASRAASPTGDTISPTDRRSFSLSSVMNDFDDRLGDYTPVSSPSYTSPVESPESVLSMPNSPELSPGAKSIDIRRGTSFQKALEIARNAEHAKLEPLDPAVISALRPPQLQDDNGEEVESPQSTPAIVVSTEVSPSTEAPESALDVTVSSQAIPIDEASPTVFTDTTESTPLNVQNVAQLKPEVAAPSVSDDKISMPVAPVIIEVTPLAVRKRRGTISRQNSDSIPSEHIPDVPPIPQIPTNVDHDAEKSTPPAIIVHDAATSKPITEDSENQENHFNSRNAALILDAISIDPQILIPPSLATGVSLTDVLNDYIVGEHTSEDEKRAAATTTPPPMVTSSTPSSPPARLAYDSPEISPAEIVESPPIPIAKPRAKATPEPLNFLSPPASGMLPSSTSASVAGGSSLNSLSTSLSSRPMSMIETSPSLVTRAMRMTPATSRGVPVFIPPPANTQPRKSDFVYFPPTPDPEESEFGEIPRGGANGSMHKASQSLSEGTAKGEDANKATTFTAVVHGKVREASTTLPSTRRYVAPSTPQMKRVQRQTIAEPPLSPGQGELAALLQEAMWLEDTLSKGELPAEIIQQKEMDERAELEVIEEENVEKVRPAKGEEDGLAEEQKGITQASTKSQDTRNEPTSGKLKHTFLIPLSKARSVHRSEGSTSSKAEEFPSRRMEQDVVRPKSAGVPDQSAGRVAKSSLPPSDVFQSQAEPSTAAAEVQPQRLEPSHTGGEYPSKSPKSSRFASFRRLGSLSRPSTMYGSSSSVRHSQSMSSEISSEDSQAVATPPEAHLEFGALKFLPANEDYGHGNRSTTSFHSLSSKKSGSNLGRAASFAEKMWSRARTKSSTSTVSLAPSEGTGEKILLINDKATYLCIVDEAPKLPAFGATAALELPTLPSVPVIVPPSPEKKSNLILDPPKRSTSLKRSTNLPPIPLEPVPPIPTIPISIHSRPQARNAEISLETSNDSLLPPGSGDSSRPTSWTSLSSAGSLGSLPSPLFDKEFFDSFPSVPGTTPMPDINTVANFPHRRDASFDSALLSSAIHLASSHKSAANPSTTTLHQQLPNYKDTPTAVSVALPRRSGESTR
uniref:Uncharacterized protein n=1 Tax=Psilocybe cubensis TaxID=181762 RepID=A0A8H8CNK5_PSICU